MTARLPLADLERVLDDLVGGSDRLVVLYAAMWPLARVFDIDPRLLADAVVDAVNAVAGPRHAVLMPTFVRGAAGGDCDLDSAPSATGEIPEAFRRREGVRRTVSALFPFAVGGPQASEVVALQPRDAWGDGSLYAWLETENAHLLTLGLHPTHNSFLHRAEWLARDRIRYRSIKPLTTRVTHEGGSFELTEQLFARTGPGVVNDFTRVLDALVATGLALYDLGGTTLGAMGAADMLRAVEPKLAADPLALLKAEAREAA